MKDEAVNRKPNEDEYIDNQGNIHNIGELGIGERVKAERNKGDFTKYLLDYVKKNKLVVLHTWVYKGMEGKILDVDLTTRTFGFLNAKSGKKARYSLNIVRGIEEL
jgi:hypothetical protein